jgi:hypothetical protein
MDHHISTARALIKNTVNAKDAQLLGLCAQVPGTTFDLKIEAARLIQRAHPGLVTGPGRGSAWIALANELPVH